MIDTTSHLARKAQLFNEANKAYHDKHRHNYDTVEARLDKSNLDVAAQMIANLRQEVRNEQQ